jgi:predicted  nucleic acid-binding Zn-ribbon protein
MVLFLNGVLLTQEVTREQWQQQMNQQTARRNELQARLDKLNADVNELTNRSSTLDDEIAACEDELFSMLGVSRGEFEAFARELEEYEQRANELMRMPDADLLQYNDEINAMSKRVGEMMKEKLGKLPRFSNRLAELRRKVDNLMAALARTGRVYTVGTWARDRDCLWNIAQKPNIYANAWLWPKIWQGNKDKIRDPDIIQPGWRLNIPPKAELSREEKSAANSYYRNKGS